MYNALAFLSVNLQITYMMKWNERQSMSWNVNKNMFIYCLDLLNVHLYLKRVQVPITHLRETRWVRSDTGDKGNNNFIIASNMLSDQNLAG